MRFPGERPNTANYVAYPVRVSNDVLGGATWGASLALPAEALLRLVYGRLDDATEMTASGVTLAELKSVFPGF